MDSPLFVVGIGASAGGLEALRPLLAHLSRTGRVAYIIAQHMAADAHAELMVALLSRESALEVVLGRDGQVLEADRVYMLPAGSDGVVRSGRLQLQPPTPEGLSRPSVNVLFESLAQEQGARAIGIIVSGTGSDGVRGCRAIRARGGLTLAQTPDSARYSGMPEAALEAKVVGESLPPQAMGGRLASLFPDPIMPPSVSRLSPPSVIRLTPPSVPPPGGDREPPPQEPGLALLLRRVRDATGMDFTSYKEETLLRRLRSRLTSLGLDSLDAYLSHLSPGEVEALAQNFLVSTSSFFRDHESFTALEGALREMLIHKPPSQPLRFWVPGCASGDECYTLAILVVRLQAASGRQVSILGTDLNPRALALAEKAVYPENAFKEADPEVLRLHFSRTGLLYQVSEPLRQMCSFVRQDVIQEEPPRDLDLISCRNLLIYLHSELQGQLMRKFQAALRPQGLLFIGPSETIGVTGNTLFRPVDSHHKIYRCR